MKKTYRTGFEVRGDASHGVQAIRQIDQALDKLDSTAHRVDRSLESAAAQSARMDRDLGGLARRAAGWTVALTGLGATLSGFSSELDHIDKLHKLNLRIDASTEALSRYDYVAELSGTTLKQLSLSWQRQTRRVSEAAVGYGAARDALVELNLDAQELNKLKPEDQFYAMAQALSEVSDKGDRLRLANKIFDSEGAAAALQIINQGVDALDQMLEKADQLNLVVSQADANAVAGYNDAVSNLDRSWQGLNKTVAVFVAHNGTEAINGLADSIAGSVDLVQHLDDVLLAGAGVLAARYVPALVLKTQATLAATVAARAQMAADVQATRQLNLRAVQEQAAAQRSLRVAQTAQLRTAAMTRLAAANQAVIATENALAAATSRYAASATVAGRASAGLMTTLGLLGGPAGVAILAASGLAVYASNVDEAKLRSQKAIGPIDQLALSLKELYRVASGGREDHQKNQLVSGFLKNDLDTLEQMIAQTANKINELNQVEKDGFFSGEYEAAQRNLVDQQQRLDALSAAYQRLTAEQKKNTDGAGNNGAGVDDLTASEQALLNVWQPKLTRLQELNAAETQLQALLKAHPKQADEVARALKNIAALRAKEAAQANLQVDKNQQLVESAGAELALMQLGERERAIQTQLRKLDADATDAQRAALRHLVGEMYDQRAALLQVEEAAKAAEERASPFAEAWAESTKRIDAAFADAWKGAFDSFEDFEDRLLDGFKQTLAEMAHLATTKPIALNITGGGVVAGAPGAGPGSLLQTGQSILQNAGSIADWFNPSSGSIVSGINNAAYQLGYGPEAVSAVGPVQPTALINPNGYVAQGLNAAGPALAAYGFGQQHGALGGVVGGAGTAALAGGISGAISGAGFLSGASGALAGLGPVGWAAIGIGALIGANKKPSDKTQWAGFTGADNAGFEGGFDGKKFSQENRDAATAVAAVLNRFNVALDQYSGTTFDSSLQVQVGGRDGVFIRTSDAGTAGQLGATPNGSATLEDVDTLYAGTDMQAALDAAIQHMADQQGVLLDVYREQARENELLSETYLRLHQQQDVVRASLAGLGIPFNAVGDDALRLADELVTAAGGLDALVAGSEFYYANFYSEQERAQHQVDQYTAVLDGFNAQFAVAIDSREDLRAYVESLDMSTAAGAAAHAAALQLAPSLIGLEQALRVVTAAANQAPSAVETLFSSDQQALLQQRAQLIYDNYQTELQAAQALHDQKLSLLNEQYQAGVALLNQMRGLALSNLSPLTPLQKQQEAQQQWSALLSRAQDGDVDALSGLDAAGRAYIEHTQNMYGSGSQSVAAYAEVMGSLEALGMRFGDQAAHDQRVSTLNQQQLTIQQQLLQASNRQLSQLATEYAELADIEVNTGTIAQLLTLLPQNLAEAISGMIAPGAASGTGGPTSSTGITDDTVRAHVSALTSSGWTGQALEERIYHDAVANGVTAAQLERSMGWAAGTVNTWADNNPDAVQAYGDLMLDGSHKSGLAWVPFDGYRAELHQGEAVLTASENAEYRSGRSERALLQEVQGLRREVARLTQVVAAVGGEQVDALADQTEQLGLTLGRSRRVEVAV